MTRPTLQELIDQKVEFEALVARMKADMLAFEQHMEYKKTGKINMPQTLDLQNDRRREHIFARLKKELKQLNGDELAAVGCPVSPDNSYNPVQEIFEWFCNHQDPDFVMDVIMNMRGTK